MLFTTPLFWLFFALVAGMHALLPQGRWRRALLLLASYVFYASWQAPRGLMLLPLLVGVTAVCWWVGGALYRGRGPRGAFLAVALLTNLGALATFKYLGLFTSVVQALGGRVSLPELFLPLGISFFTFQAMSYVLDAWRGQGQAYRSPLDFALFVAFFPQLIAGPIVRAEHFRAELDQGRPTGWVALDQGLRIATVGLVLKVFADNVGVYVDGLYAHPQLLTRVDAVAAALGFGMQIYGDFAGYSLIAMGVARVFGVHLPQNFRLPWLATGPQDFWRRWHITLSTWFRDYVYIPLGGSRRGLGWWVVAVLITFGLSGLWHGAGGRFLVWGLAHGALLLAERGLRKVLPQSRGLDWLITGAGHACIVLLWLFFRAHSLGDALSLLSAVFVGSGGVHLEAVAVLWLALPFGLYHLLSWRRQPEEAVLDWGWGWVVAGAVAWAGVTAWTVGGVDFVYFAF